MLCDPVAFHKQTCGPLWPALITTFISVGPLGCMLVRARVRNPGTNRDVDVTVLDLLIDSYCLISGRINKRGPQGVKITPCTLKRKP